jgi:AAA family ATP:ADP antiporter
MIPRVLGASLLFLCMIGNYLAKPVRDAYMLQFWGVANLPWLNIAVLLAVAMAAQMQAVAFHRRGPAIIAPIAGILVLLCLGACSVLPGGREAAIVLACGVGLLNMTAYASAWGLIDSAFDENKAPRAFGPVGLGGAGGAAVGAVVAAFVARWGPPALVCGAGLTVAMFVMLSLPFSRAARAETAERRRFARAQDANESGLDYRGWRIVTTFPYTRTVLLLTATISAVGATFRWGLFRLGGLQTAGVSGYTLYFANTYGIIAVGAFLIQLFVTPVVLRRFRGGPALLLVPIIALGTAIAAILGASAHLVWLTTVTFMALDYTTNQCARELLYVPAPIEIRTKAKQHIDTSGRQVGVIGSNVIMGMLLQADGSTAMLGVTLVAFALGWLVVANRARIAHARLVAANSDGDVASAGPAVGTVSG